MKNSSQDSNLITKKARVSPIDPLTHLVSLSAKNAKLVPLKVYKDRQESLFHSFRRSNALNDYSKLAGIVNEMSSASLEDQLYHDEDNVCFYDIKIQNENNETIDYNLIKGYKSCSNNTNGEKSYVSIPFKVDKNQSKDLPIVEPDAASNSSLKVEYVPRGKIITVNVSVMW